MRTFELHTDIPAGREHAWQVLTDLTAWSKWNHLVPAAAGALRPGATLELMLRNAGGVPQPFRPVVLAVTPPRELVLAAAVGPRWMLQMVHTFQLEATGPDTAVIRQRWIATGLMAPVLWPVLRRNMMRFAELGADLARQSVAVAHAANSPDEAHAGAAPSSR
jgi:hypothetical protein